MKIKLGLVAGCFFVGSSGFAQKLVFVAPVAEEKSARVSSIYELESVFVEQQYQYLPVSPPSDEVFFQSLETVVPVDWRGFPAEFTKQMVAEMDANGYPLYRVAVYEDFVTRETVFLNRYGREVYRLPPEKGYDPYAWQEATFGVEAALTLDELSRWIYDPAHIAVDLVLIPEVFHTDYLAAETGLASEAVALPMMMSMSSTGETPIPVAMVPQTNGTIDLLIDAASQGVRHIEIFAKDDLICGGSWNLVLGNISITNTLPVVWSDVTSTDTKFYYVNDADDDRDGDGYSDLRERYSNPATDPDLFNAFDAENYGAGDGLPDWYEIRFWGSIGAYTASDDPDGDGLANGEELVWDGVPSNVVLLSDPSLFDSDFDGLDDGVERTNWLTEAMNPDTDFDGLSDGAEINGSPRTDPHNPDTIAPTVSFL